MNIIFRVDASIQIGTGHVMRCLTLADALKKKGGSCYFICREHSGNLIAAIKERSYEVYSLPLHEKLENNEQCNSNNNLDHATWLGTTQEVDADLSIPIVRLLKPDWMIVDHYAIDRHWEKKLKPYCNHIMVIDDLADRYHDCDLLLDQTFGREAEAYVSLVAGQSQLLCGVQFALLRPEFEQWRDYSLNRRIDGKIEHLLISLGGVDKDNITNKILKSLINSPLPENAHITVVMGSTAPWVLDVKEQAEIMPWKTDVKVGINNMAELMANSDLSIGAAGATSWERCCLGLPTIMVVLADNQKLIASKLKGAGATLFLEKECINSQILHSYIGDLVNSSHKLIKLGNFSANIVNGMGVSAVLKRMSL
jgi:UDP-2,4-diacetamido-2,4,6-trideoxy-beta-L-altropyranose hydrolase